MPTEQGVGGSSPPRRVYSPHDSEKSFPTIKNLPKSPRVGVGKASNSILFLPIRMPLKSSGLLHNIINQIGDELVIINSSGRIVYVNDAVVQGLGYSSKEILKHNITDFFKTKMTVQEWKRSQFTLLKRLKKPVSYQLERVVKSGATQVIDVTVVYMSYEGRELVLSVGRDVTRQLATQQNLKESEDLYRLLSEGAGDGIFMADLKGRITYVNRTLEQMVDIPFKVSQGKLFHKYVAESSVKKALACFKAARKGGSKLQENIEILSRGGGKVPVEINVSPLYKDGRIVSVHAIIRDIRGRKRYEQLMAESEKMKAVQYFYFRYCPGIKTSSAGCDDAD